MHGQKNRPAEQFRILTQLLCLFVIQAPNLLGNSDNSRRCVTSGQRVRMNGLA